MPFQERPAKSFHHSYRPIRVRSRIFDAYRSQFTSGTTTGLLRFLPANPFATINCRQNRLTLAQNFLHRSPGLHALRNAKRSVFHYNKIRFFIAGYYSCRCFGSSRSGAKGLDLWPIFQRPEQAAEKGLNFVRTPEIHPAGAKARVDFAALTSRLKSCPDTKRPFGTPFTSFSAACKGPCSLRIVDLQL